MDKLPCSLRSLFPLFLSHLVQSPTIFCQIVADCTRPLFPASPEIPPCAWSLSNYRCKPGVSERLPALNAPSPVNGALPMTRHCVPCFHALTLMSCEVKSDKSRLSLETNGAVQTAPRWISKTFSRIILWRAQKPAEFNLHE